MRRASGVAVWLWIAVLPWAALGAEANVKTSEPSQAEQKTMAQVTVERLGKATVFERTGSWRGGDANEPEPLVLWRGSELAAVLYYGWQSNTALGRFTQHISSVDGDNASLKSVLGAYPIKFSTTLSYAHAEEGSNAIDHRHVTTGDVNGDGVDELIVPRYQGELEVYGLTKRLFSWQSTRNDPKHYSHKVTLVHQAQIDGRLVIYYVYHHEPWKGLSTKDAPPLADTLLEVSSAGIKEVKLQGLPGANEQIAGVAVWNRPGSKQVDGLVLCTRFDGNETMYQSVHSRDGQLRTPAREVYVLPRINAGEELSNPLPPRWNFVFVPQSNVLAAISSDNNEMTFVRPEQPVNWFQRVDVRGATDSSEAVFFGMVDVASGEPKALWMELVDRRLYLFDRNGLSEATIGKQAATGAEVSTGAPDWPRITTHSPEHRLQQVRWLDDGQGTMLVVQSKELTERRVSIEEGREAATKFLPPGKLAEIEAFNAPTFKNISEYNLASERQRHHITEPITTIEDLQRYLPDYYKQEVMWSASGLQTHLQSELVMPRDQGRDPAALGYRNIPAYKEWLKTLSSPAELRLQLVRRGEVISEAVLVDTLIYSTDPSPFIPSRFVVTKRAAGELKIVLPLLRLEAGKAVTGFYVLHLLER